MAAITNPTAPDFFSPARDATGPYNARQDMLSIGARATPKSGGIESSGGNGMLLTTATIISGLVGAGVSGGVGIASLVQNRRLSREAKEMSAKEYADQLRFSEEELSMEKRDQKRAERESAANIDMRRVALALGLKNAEDQKMQSWMSDLNGAGSGSVNQASKIQGLWG